MRRTVVSLVALVAVGGCSSWEYHKPGVTSAQVADDARACREAATDASLGSIPAVAGDESVTVPSERLDRRAFNRCMGERGYAVRGYRAGRRRRPHTTDKSAARSAGRRSAGR